MFCALGFVAVEVLVSGGSQKCSMKTGKCENLQKYGHHGLNVFMATVQLGSLPTRDNAPGPKISHLCCINVEYYDYRPFFISYLRKRMSQSSWLD